MVKSITLYFGLITGLLVLLFFYQTTRDQPQINDSTEYKQLAHNLLESNTTYAGDVNKTIDYRLFSKRTLGFPLLLVLQHQNHYLISTVQILLVLLNFILGLQLLQQFSKKKQSFVIYSLFFSLHLTLFLHSTFILADLFLATIILLVTQIFYDKKSTLNSKVVSISFLWAFGLMIKPVLLPSLVIIPILLIWFRAKHQRWHFTLLAPLLVFLITSYFNYKNTNQYEYSSISTINIGQYNAKLTIAKKYGYDSAQNFTSLPAFATPRSLPEYQSYKRDVKSIAIHAITQNFYSYLKVHIVGCVKMVIDPGRFELYTFYGEPTSQISLTEMLYAGDLDKIKETMGKNKTLFFVFVLLFIISLIKLGGVFFSIKHIKQTGFILILILYFVGITGPIGAARFFLPVSVLYVILASIGWTSVLQFLQKRSKG